VPKVGQFVPACRASYRSIQQYEFIDVCFVKTLLVAKIDGRGDNWKSFRSRILGGKFGN